MEDLTMELTVMNKRRYDALIGKITNLETEIAIAHTQLKAIQDSNNQLAEIAFDENRFTQQLLDKVEETAREVARDTVDIDDIVSEVQDNIDVSEDVERAVGRLDLVDSDKVNDKIQDFINDSDILDSGAVESLVADYLSTNDYLERSDAESMIEEAVTDLKETIVREVLQLIANKLTGKDTHHDNNDRDRSLHLSGTVEASEARSYNATSA
jgi:cell division protein FtsB